jgi:hypothetical protein
MIGEEQHLEQWKRLFRPRFPRRSIGKSVIMPAKAEGRNRALVPHSRREAMPLAPGHHTFAADDLRRHGTPPPPPQDHLLAEMREGGLGEDEAEAEARRLRAGDIWCG